MQTQHTRSMTRHEQGTRSCSLSLRWGFLLACLAVCAPSSVDAAILRLKEQAVVTGPVVTLKDVAEILEPDAAKLQKLERVLICPAPAEGRGMVLDYQLLRNRLVALGFPSTELEFSGANATRVTQSSPTVPVKRELPPPAARVAPAVAPMSVVQQKQLNERIGDLISQTLSAQYRQLGRLDVNPQLDAEQTRLLLSAQPQHVSVSGFLPHQMELRQVLLFEFTDGKGGRQTLKIPCEIRILPKVLAVRDGVPRGKILSSEDLAWRAPLDSELNDTFQSARPDEVLGKQTKRNLPAGTALSTADVETVPLVKTNDIITVVSRSGRITVRMEATARGSGALGDMVQVVSLDGRRRLQGKVIGYHEVEISADRSTVSIPTSPSPTSPERLGISQVSGERRP